MRRPQRGSVSSSVSPSRTRLLFLGSLLSAVCMIDCSSDDSGEDDTAETITEVEETSTSVGEGSDGPTDEGGTGNAGGNWNAPTGSKKGTSNTGSTDMELPGFRRVVLYAALPSRVKRS